MAVILAFIGVKSGYHVGKQANYPVAYSEYIVKYSSKYKLDPYLVMAVIKVESNFVPEAESDYAAGLMQLTEETAEWNAKEMGLEDYDYKDPETNIKIGCHYLKHLIDKYENVDTALAAYNGGMGNVSKWLKDSRYSDDGITLKNIPFPETKNYVKKVNANWENYKQLYQ
jgi:soluble lytic murein transglycosylase